MSSFPITALYAGCVGLLSVSLANYVLYARINASKLADWKPDAAVRVQGNFVENVPLTLVLLYLVEVSGYSSGVVHIFGIWLVVVRVLHAWGLGHYRGANYPRLIGAQGTFLLQSVLAMALIYGFL